MSKTFLELFGLRPVKPYRRKDVQPIPNPSPQLLYGLELEIERCRGDMAVAGMSETTDGSLRNNGLEFITQPMTYSNVAAVLQEFFTKNSFLGPESYSENTSVHVHTNVQDMTMPQLTALIVLYQVFEKVLFNWVGDERDKNIYCIPWTETQLNHRTVSRLLKDETYILGDWVKYTALNLQPIVTQGSIEWRHMGGCGDPARILLWCRLIGHMYSFAKALEYQKVLDIVSQLNTNSQYRAALLQVFNSDAEHLMVPGYEELLEEGVLNMKYSIMQPDKVTAKKVMFGTPEELNRMMQEIQQRYNWVDEPPVLVAQQVPPTRAVLDDAELVNSVYVPLRGEF